MISFANDKAPPDDDGVMLAGFSAVDVGRPLAIVLVDKTTTDRWSGELQLLTPRWWPVFPEDAWVAMRCGLPYEHLL